MLDCEELCVHVVVQSRVPLIRVVSRNAELCVVCKVLQCCEALRTVVKSCGRQSIIVAVQRFVKLCIVV